VLAEGSVSYLYAPERLEPVLRVWPQAKFIICVRNPLQLVPSLHQRHFVNGDETIREFDRAWALVPERRNGRHIPRSCLDPRFLDYWEAGNLGRHVERFFSVIGRERCLVSVFDDLQADPRREYRRVLDFLGLPDDGKDEFERHAESKDCRLPRLQRLLQRPPRFALGLLDSDDLHNPRFAETAGPFLRKLLDLRTRILDWNEIPAERPRIDPVVIDEAWNVPGGRRAAVSAGGPRSQLLAGRAAASCRSCRPAADEGICPSGVKPRRRARSAAATRPSSRASAGTLGGSPAPPGSAQLRASSMSRSPHAPWARAALAALPL